MGLLLPVLGAQAQQNLFNIPAGDLTPRGKVFFQHQTNVYDLHTFESKNHFVYGLGSGFEVGLNAVNIKFNLARRNAPLTLRDGRDPNYPLKPLLQLTGQKFFYLTEHLKTSIGTQVGLNPVRFRPRRQLTHFSYNTWVYEPRRHWKLVAGPYLTDVGSVGPGNRVGVLAGFEVPVHRRLLVMGDFVSGRHAAAVSVLGVNFLATQRLQLCAGALLPNPGSGNRAGVVFELNLLGYDEPFGDDH
ncbi:hypothetical protein D3Y59_17600 [Hymenobacter oligotrophus]|uniref:DUF2490 domain-containing protein n=1 Tax=Hymenobacter oligotrophus TaxID=2319843 RepID=A0A3B7R3W7_9BACT|nr:hypothetical protein [Hymenobacter oligotrophus]AYA38705.1 hypothetical protein D3Y59_17600 [Hymenobacter oligotrophus]